MPSGYYRSDLSLIHHRGFGFHADRCAPGILALLGPVRDRGGLVLELGCGSGLLTRHLVDAGHRVYATDASPAMLEIAEVHASGAEEFRRITLPEDSLPPADAVVATGHPLNYLPSEEAIRRAFVAVAGALQPGGVMAVDLCDLEWGRYRAGDRPQARIGDDWALFTQYAIPAPNRFDRHMTTFVRTADGTYRRDEETHENVLIEATRIPELLAGHGVTAEVRSAFGREELPIGLVAIVGRKQ